MLSSIIISLERLGQYENPIFIHKFRTMYKDAEKEFPILVNKNGIDSFGKIIDDPRIIPFGRFMRRYFIDELPQLYDLQRGVISLVGIRAKNELCWKRYPLNHKKRALQFKPGLFGIPYYHLDLRDFQDYIQAEIEYLDRLEKENPGKVNREYIRTIIQNVIFKGLRSK